MATMKSNHTAPGAFEAGAKVPTSEDVRSIGEIIRDTRSLTADQVEQILLHQKENGVRFGEAAIALGMATPDDVLQALAQQFNYSYTASAGDTAYPELCLLHQPFSQQAEAFRAIRAQIQLRARPAEHDGPLRRRRALAVVSPDAGDGKTYFAANLAVSLAQLGAKTLLIDADLRGPRINEVLKIEAGIGLSGLLAGRRGDAVIQTVPAVPNLFVLPVGVQPPNPLELLQGPAFALLLQELMNRFEHVIVDTPAATYGADSVVIAARCGMALVIARKDRTRARDIKEFTSSLMAANVQLAGVVMNEA